MRIQHNIMAMNAYRNYNTNNSALSKNLEKLSSGYSINRAGDDAAGLAISEKMRAQITGLDTAQKNAKDGISLVQTAEGALTEVHDMLNRMVELATQSANGTYEDGTDRAQLQKEIQQLTSEIDRIADSANFNGIKLLDGNLEGTVAETKLSDATVTSVVTAQAGSSGVKGKFEVDLSNLEITNSSTGAIDATVKIGDMTITVNVGAGKTVTGKDVLAQITDTNATFAANGAEFKLTISGGKLTAEMTEIPTIGATGASIQTNFAVSVTTTAGLSHNNKFNAGTTTMVDAVAKEQEKAASATFDLASMNVDDGTAIKIGDETYIFSVGKDTKYGGGKNVIDLSDFETTDANFNSVAAAALTKAAAGNKMVSVGQSADGTITLTEKDGAIDYNKFDLTKSDGWDGFVQVGTATTGGTTGGLKLQIGDTAEDFNQLNVSIDDMHASSLGVSSIDISSQSGAEGAVEVIKNAINMVSDVRGTLGATQNRLDHTINNLSVMEENIQDAESTIRDTDVAEEMMAYTKNNILIQSAQAMLAQANQVPQGVLQLLG